MTFPRMLRRALMTLAVGGASVFATAAAQADVASVLPAVFAEPGDHGRWRQTISGVQEEVDPFSGSLRVNHTDLVLPGNGGLDIVVRRHYSSNVFLSRPSPLSISPTPSVLLSQSPVGQGWTLHFGRAIKSESENRAFNHICSTDFDPSLGDTTLDAGVLELPDGTLDTLYRSAGGPTRFITRRHWLADCTAASDGLIVYAPNGLKYTMNHAVSAFDDVTYTARTTTAWHTTKIEDTNGNYIAVSYTGQRGSYALVREVTASDGRQVTFAYSAGNLASISANGQTWRYEYAQVSGRSYLARVVRPDELSWSYEYADPEVSHVLSKVTYPYGATVTYAYDYADFMGDPALRGFDVPPMDSVVVSTKTQAGRGVEPGTWRYSYAPASDDSIEPGFRNDVTTVDFPGGRSVFHHYGMQRQLQINDTVSPRELWKTGLLKKKETYQTKDDGTFELLQTESYDWMAQGVISQQLNVALVYPVFDRGVFLPQTTRRTFVREDTSYVTEFSYPPADAAGSDPRPNRIVESGQATRSTELVWYPANPAKAWKFDQILYEIVDGDPYLGTLREFDYENGNLLALQPRGVVERFRYDTHGNVIERVNARGARTRFDDYYRGVPRSETREVYSDEWVTLLRVVNDSGTIRSEADGRGNSTGYEYDELDRLVAVTKPAGAAIAVTWDATGRTVTRANYRERTEYDGFGRPLCASATDTNLNVRVAEVTRYDALGRKIASSLPFEGSCASAGDGPPGPGRAGDEMASDVLGRVTSVTHSDGARVLTQYLPDNRVRVTNERGASTVYAFRSFGNPDNADERVVLRIEAPEDVVTTFTRNVLGQISSVTQGPGNAGSGQATRTNTYDPNRHFLLTSTEPETGTTTYVRDQIGNMISRQVGAAPAATYQYDGLNRLVRSSIPGSADAQLFYDANDNVTDAIYGTAARHYEFDANDNVASEALQVDGLHLDVSHTYTPLDGLATTRYHSGKTVSFAPDALGRPTRAAPFVTSASHHPNGEFRTITYENGVRTEIGLDERQFTSSIAAPGVLGLGYEYDGRGNPTRITDTIQPQNQRSLGYDGLDRLTGANGSWGVGQFNYDANGNITRAMLGGRSLAYEYDPQRRLLARITGGASRSYDYDALGNVTSDGTTAFGFDGRGHLRTIAAPGGGDATRNDYDASGRRIRQQRGAETTYYFHSKGGALLGEYSLSSQGDRLRSKEYAYLGGKLVAAVENEAALPVVNAGNDVVIDEASTVRLSGSASVTGGTISGFHWTQFSGPAVSLQNADTASPSFVAPFVDKTTYFWFRLKAFGDQGTSAYDELLVTVRDLKVDSDRDGMADGWELEHFGSLTESGTSDHDGDGVDNRHEFEEGSDPNAPSAPTPVRALTVVPGAQSNTVTWVSSFGLGAAYDLYFSQRAGFDPFGTDGSVQKLGGIQSPFVHESLGANQTYYYRIVARSPYGVASPSPEQRATVGQAGFDFFTPLEPRAHTETGSWGFATSADGTAFAVWSERDAPLNVGRVWAARYEPSAGFREATLLEDAPGEVMGEPKVAMDARGNALAVWTRSGLLRTAAFAPGTGWQSPSSVSPLSGDSPTLVMNAGGRALLLWYSSRTQLFEYRPGAGWSAPSALTGGSHGTGASQVALNDNGAAAVVFQHVNVSTGGVGVSALVDDGSGWSEPVVLAEYASPRDSANLRLTLDLAGRATAAWWERDPLSGQGKALWAARHRPGSPWQPAQRLDSAGALRSNGDLTLASDGAGRVQAAWQQVDAVDGVERTRLWSGSYDAATEGWSAPEVLSSDDGRSPYFPSLALNQAGDGILVWTTTPDYAVSARRFVAGVGWQTTQEISELNRWIGPWPTMDARGNAWLLVASPARIPGLVHHWLLDGGGVKNMPPTVNAGPDQATGPGALVHLTGAATRDVDGTVRAYRWTQVLGPAAELDDATSSNPSFVAPAVGADAAVLAFRLTATDDAGAENADVVHVTITGGTSDTDADGLSDGWELTYFGNLSARADEDPDRDGLTNLQEHREGTDPTVPEPVPARVTGLSATSVSATQNNLRWNAVPSVVRYNLYVRTSPGVTKANGTKLAGVSSPYGHLNLASGTTYYYVVTAENGSGESTESVEVSATPRVHSPGTWQPTRRVDSGGRSVGNVRVTIADDGRAVAAWLYFDSTSSSFTLFTSTFAPGTGWSTPVQQATRADLPVLAAAGEAIFLVWRELAADDTWTIWSKRQAANGAWESAAAVLRNVPFNQPVPSLVGDGEGAALVIISSWYPTELWAVRFDTASWLAPEVIASDAFDAALASDGAGGSLVVFKSRDGTELHSRRHGPTSGWSPELVVTGGTPIGLGGRRPIQAFHLAMNQAGIAFLAWEEPFSVMPNVDRYRVWATHGELGTGWGAAHELDAGDPTPHVSPRVSVAPSGDAIVAWMRDGPPSVQVDHFTAGVWNDAPIALTAERANRIELASNDDGDAVVVWLPASGSRVGWNGFVAGEGWGAPAQIPGSGSSAGPDYPAFAMNARGDAMVAWGQSDGSVLGLWASSFRPAGANQPPTANAGADQSVDEGASVALVGTGADSDGTVARYAWTQTGGPPVSLGGADTARATFLAPAVSASTTLSFQLTVTDDAGATATDAVDVVVRDVPVPNRDLVTSAVSTTATRVNPGGTLNVSNTVANRGTVGITTSFVVRLYASTDATITSSDTPIGARNVASLGAGASSTQKTTATIPTSLTPGSYFIGAIADDSGAISETNEANNALAGNSVAVIRDVDLTMTALSANATTVTRGGSLTLTNSVKNQGTNAASGGIDVGLYLSTDRTITTADVALSTRSVASLGAGATSTAATAVVIPSTLAAGNYYIGALADPANTQLETNETNNARSGARIQVR